MEYLNDNAGRFYVFLKIGFLKIGACHIRRTKPKTKLRQNRSETVVISFSIFLSWKKIKGFLLKKDCTFLIVG